MYLAISNIKSALRLLFCNTYLLMIQEQFGICTNIKNIPLVKNKLNSYLKNGFNYHIDKKLHNIKTICYRLQSSLQSLNFQML